MRIKIPTKTATKKCVIKWKLEDYKHFLQATQLENKSNQLKKYSWCG